MEFEAFCQDCGKRRDGGGRGHCESLCKLGSSRPEKAEECGVEVRQINVSSSKQTPTFQLQNERGSGSCLLFTTNISGR